MKTVRPLSTSSIRLLLCFLIGLCLFVSTPKRAAAYSLLTHEELVDLAWNSSIRGLLLQRFPNTTEAELQTAHAFAYGGCAIQDMGYYPFGHAFFSDLTHYVRTGDFIDALFRNAHTVNEYAFALGALSHYLADNIGHQNAINLSTPVEFPGLEKKYGPVVTYDEDPHAHVRTEFAFDIYQLSQQRFAPANYKEMIGLQVPRRQMERAFFETYGLTLRSQLGRERPAFRSYRSSVRHFVPRIAYAEALIHQHEFPADNTGPEFQKLQNRLAKAEAEGDWAKYNHPPGIGTHLLGYAIRIIPKVGVFSILGIRGPTADTESKYVTSLNNTDDAFDQWIAQVQKQDHPVLQLPNLDLDTGAVIAPGSYRLIDKTYADLLLRITKDPNRLVPATLKKNLIDFYADPHAPIATKKNKKAWARVQRELPILQGMKTVTLQTAKKIADGVIPTEAMPPTNVVPASNGAPPVKGVIKGAGNTATILRP